MNVIEVEPLVSPLAPETPAGADLEYDPQYFELEKLAQGVPEATMGDETKPGEEPDWSKVKETAFKLFERTRDLRVALILTVALLKEDGLPGFRDGMAIIRGLVEKLWDHFYPRLDPADNNDPTIRVNLLKNLNGNPISGDMYKVIERLKESILTNSKQRIGAYNYRDIQIANGEITPAPSKNGAPAAAPPTKALVDAAFQDTPTEDLQATRGNLQGALDDLTAVDAAVGEKVGAANGPDFTELNNILREILAVIDEKLASRGMAQEVPAASSDASAPAPAEPAPAPPAGISGEISSREDVIQMLDKIIEYYERYEPASPVPIFMNRAKRLVTMKFDDLIKDLAPEAAAKIAVFRGDPPA
jgi:type VI secretion system protein ImpA